jgi:hypothetical protein
MFVVLKDKVFVCLAESNSVSSRIIMDAIPQIIGLWNNKSRVITIRAVNVNDPLLKGTFIRLRFVIFEKILILS